MWNWLNFRLNYFWGLALLLPLMGCLAEKEQVRAIAFEQKWQVQPGDVIAGYSVTSGLGDIGLNLNGGKVIAPFNGKVQPTTLNCVLFSSPEIPAYLLRLCGMPHPKLGRVQQGQPIGSARTLHLSVLRRTPEKKWMLVEPSRYLIERSLKVSS